MENFIPYTIYKKKIAEFIRYSQRKNLMNIAILIPELGGGGAERIAQLIGDYYYNQGHKVYYFLMSNMIKQLYPVKGQVIQTDIKSCTEDKNSVIVFLKLYLNSFTIRKLKRIYSIDVSISFMEECNYLNILSKRNDKVITRICTILSKRDFNNHVLYHPKTIRFFYNLADKVVVMSKYAKKEMADLYGIKRKKIKIIPNPSLERIVNEGEKEWKYGKNTVVCIGRLEGVKQQERIIKAFSHVAENNKEAKLLILGKGHNEKYLKAVCSRYCLQEKVIFLGFQYDIGFYLRNSRVFVMASQVEGFPNSMVEAMAYGVPVVTMDSPGACGEIVGNQDDRELKKGEIRYCKYGILTPYITGKMDMGEELSDEELSFATAIEKVLENEELYMEYGRRAKKRSEIYNINHVMNIWNKIIV